MFGGLDKNFTVVSPLRGLFYYMDKTLCVLSVSALNIFSLNPSNPRRKEKQSYTENHRENTTEPLSLKFSVFSVTLWLNNFSLGF